MITGLGAALYENSDAAFTVSPIVAWCIRSGIAALRVTKGSVMLGYVGNDRDGATGTA